MSDKETTKIRKKRGSYLESSKPYVESRTCFDEKFELNDQIANYHPKECGDLPYPKNSNEGSREYYKNFDIDVIPIKEADLTFQNQLLEHSGKGDNNKPSLTNTELNRLESRIYKSISQELQSDASIASIESNIKNIKTSFQEIFDIFYTNMREFEFCKMRFYDIVTKNKKDTIAEMECVIKDIIQNIPPSESSSNISSQSSPNKESTAYDSTEDRNDNLSDVQERKYNLQNEMDMHNNNTPIRDVCSDDIIICNNVQNTCDLYVLNSVPVVEMNMLDRYLKSEITFKDNFQDPKNETASADNLQKLANKRLQLENYMNQKQDCHLPDREIPVKESSAQNNISLNRDMALEKDINKNLNLNRSFISKICCYLCKKFCRSPFN